MYFNTASVSPGGTVVWCGWHITIWRFQKAFTRWTKGEKKKKNLERIRVELTCYKSSHGLHHVNSHETEPLGMMGKCHPFFYTAICFKECEYSSLLPPLCDPLPCSDWQVNMLLTTVLDKRYVIEHQSRYWLTDCASDGCVSSKKPREQVCWERVACLDRCTLVDVQLFFC